MLAGIPCLRGRGSGGGVGSSCGGGGGAIITARERERMMNDRFGSRGFWLKSRFLHCFCVSVKRSKGKCSLTNASFAS